jgi:hypothetical protein
MATGFEPNVHTTLVSNGGTPLSNPKYPGNTNQSLKPDSLVPLENLTLMEPASLPEEGSVSANAAMCSPITYSIPHKNPFKFHISIGDP